MKLAKILLVSILFVFLIGIVNAQLEIVDVDAKVGGKTDSGLTDTEEIRAAEPEDSVKITINFRNDYDKDDPDEKDYDIESVDITLTVVGIDDEGDDDIELDEEIDTIRPGREKKESFTFKVPLIVEDGTYDVTIDIDYKDTNPNVTGTQSLSWTLSLPVEKDRHKVIISKAELSRNNIECVKTTTLNVQMMNLGEDDEEEAVLEIFSEDLGIDTRNLVELDAGIDDDSRYTRLVSIDTEELEQGTYPIIIKTYRKNGDELEATKTVDLVILECVEEEPEPEITVAVCGNNVVETGEACDDGNAVSGDGCSASCTVEEGTTPTGYVPVEFEESFWEKYGTTVMIIIGELVFLFVILIVVAVALRKR